MTYHVNTKHYYRNTVLYFISSNSLDTLKRDVKRAELPFKVVQGRFQGQSEDALCIVDSGRVASADKLLRYLGRAHQQTCILKIGLRNDATLLYSLGHEESIGYWHGVSKSKALQCESSTFDSQTDQYYICK